MRRLEIMNRSELGQTGLLVTPICIGTGAISNVEATTAYITANQAYSTIRAAFANPFNCIDTAAIYGNTEEITGNVLKEIGGLQSGYVLQTKVDGDPVTGNFNGAQTEKSLKRSLERLGLEYLQIVYIHDPEHTTFENIMSSGGALEVLKRYKSEGVIGHIGIAGGPIDMLLRYVETGEFEAVITHNRYNLLHRGAEPLIAEASRRKLAVLNAAPFGSGILADPSCNRFAYQPASPDILHRLGNIKKACQKYGVSVRAAALHFSAKDPRIASTIVGPTSPKHIKDYINLLSVKIPDELFEEIDKYAVYSGDPEEGRFNS